MEIKVRKSESKDVGHIAKHMRASDVHEIFASDHKTPEQALKEGMEKSIYVRTIQNSVPIAVFGICPTHILGDKATIWCLGTDDIDKMKITFLRHNKEYLDEMLSYYPRLENFVHSKNTKSIQWLRFLGATIEEAKPYGAEQELFHRFFFERKN